jgi:hypothetical protein
MTDDALPDGRLFEVYERYIGEPDAPRDVYAGFSLFFAGVLLAVVALVLFLYSGQFDFGTDAFFQWRTPTYALAMVSLPVTLLAVVVLLPVERKAEIGGGAGTAICLLAVVWFLQVYPYSWEAGTQSNSVPVILLYSLGLAVVLGSTGAALVSYYVAQATDAIPDIEPAEDPEPEETITDEQVEADIEEAMEDVELTWGGVERTETTPLTLSDEEFDVDTTQFEANVERVESENVDDSVAGLQALKGGQKKTERSESSIDDQTAQLNDLKQRKREQEAEDVAAEQGLLAKLRRFIDGLFSSGF